MQSQHSGGLILTGRYRVRHLRQVASDEPSSATAAAYAVRRKTKALTAIITPADWDRIVEVYERHGGYSIKVAHELGWTHDRARRFFYKGVPSMGYPPIRTLLAMDNLSTEQIRARRAEIEEQIAYESNKPAGSERFPVRQKKKQPVVETPEAVEAQAVVIQETEQARLRELVRLEEQRRKAREDAIQSRAEEATLVSINRRNAIALNGLTAKLMSGAAALSESIQQELEKMAQDKRVSTAEKLQLVRSAASVARFNSEATMLAIKSERMVLGQPIEAEPETRDDGTLDQAVEWIEMSIAAVRRARERGLLTATTQPVDPKTRR